MSLRPTARFTSTALAAGPNGDNVAPAEWVVGADHVTLLMSGATAVTLPSAVALIAASPFESAGYGGAGSSYVLRIANSSGDTLTVSADPSITTTGTLTIDAGTWREFYVQLTSATTASLTSVGTGTWS